MNLWGQVRTVRGQILVGRTGDDTLRVLCCAFVRCAMCVLLVCTVWVLACVLVCVCVGVGVGVSR